MRVNDNKNLKDYDKVLFADASRRLNFGVYVNNRIYDEELAHNINQLKDIYIIKTQEYNKEASEIVKKHKLQQKKKEITVNELVPFRFYSTASGQEWLYIGDNWVLQTTKKRKTGKLFISMSNIKTGCSLKENISNTIKKCKSLEEFEKTIRVGSVPKFVEWKGGMAYSIQDIAEYLYSPSSIIGVYMDRKNFGALKYTSVIRGKHYEQYKEYIHNNYASTVININTYRTPYIEDNIPMLKDDKTVWIQPTDEMCKRDAVIERLSVV